MSEHQEYQYLNLVEKIISCGKKHKNRTGIETRRLLCEVMRFDLSQEFPLITTRKMYWNTVAHELLWFLSGSTNIKYLNDNNVHIWDANAKDFYEKQSGYQIYGNLGPVYGYQWRNFNGQGYDQIIWAINQIKTNSQSRRILVSAWNPLQIEDMALPPCHVLFQFSVDEDFLHCTLYQRSCDMGLGVPTNISSYALLTYLIAYVCGLKPGILNHVLNDAHIYENHLEALTLQLERTPYPFPKIKINNNKNNIFDISFNDIELIEYQHHPPIKMEMAV